MASTYLTRTQTAGTSTRKFTFSAWVKRAGQLGASYSVPLFGSYYDDSNRGSLYCYQDQLLTYFKSGGSDQFLLKTNAKYRDVNGWYHFVMAVDTTQSTANNRVKLYVNGEQIAVGDLEINNQPSQNADFATVGVNSRAFEVGRMRYGSTPTNILFDGSMSHVHFTDGYTYAASDFGSTDSTTGEWKINTSPSVTYGTNGFFILKDGNSVTDSSTNSNNFTVGGGTLTKTEDCPSNVFATLNPLNSFYSGATFSNGNNRVSLTSGTYAAVSSTLGFNSGKWYAEFKAADATNWVQVGIVAQNPTASGQPLGYFSDSYGYIGGTAAGGVNSLMNNDSNTSYASTYGNGDIISVAVDCDNNKLYFGLNGTWLNSGNPESGATGTGAAFTISSSPTSGFYYFAVGNYSGSQTPDWEANFGNGYFGTTAVSSAGTNASGNGIFEYDVPTGYTALSTKGLNS
jgi:hypothetical protein